MVELLLGYKANVNAISEHGETEIYMGLANVSILIIRMILTIEWRLPIKHSGFSQAMRMNGPRRKFMHLSA
jgi:hypothetical protein